MNQSFINIASINFEHSYFSQSGFSRFDLIVRAENQKRLNNLQLLINRQNTGFNILSENPELLKFEKKLIYFQLFFNDSFFWNYSDLEYPKKNNEIIRLSNDMERQDMSCLHFGAYLNQEDYVSNFDFVRLTSFIKEVNSDVVIESDEGEIEVAKGTLNLSSLYLEEGFYKIKSESGIKSIYYNSELGFKNPDAIISINPEELFNGFSSSGILNYKIRIKNRSTIWRYILADSFYSNFSKLEVLDMVTKELAFFESEVAVSPRLKLPCLQSKDSIPLNGDIHTRFQLVDQYNPEIRSGKIIIKNLPIPEVNMIQVEGDNKEILYSNIFI